MDNLELLLAKTKELNEVKIREEGGMEKVIEILDAILDMLNTLNEEVENNEKYR
jgi:hypothetical protein